MHPVLERLKRERRWALALFVVAAAVIVLIQRFVVPHAAEPVTASPPSENAG